jgi:hypothetical protein
MRGLNENEFANAIKDCFLSVWIDETSAYGTFPLESMKVGVPVLGLVPNLVPSWMNEDNGLWINNKNQIVEIHKASEFKDKFMPSFNPLAVSKGLQQFGFDETIPADTGNYFIVVGAYIDNKGRKPVSYPVLLMSNGTYTILNQAKTLYDKLRKTSLCPTPPIKSGFITFEQKPCPLPDTRVAPRTSIANSRFDSMFSRKNAPAASAASATPAAVVAKGGRRTKKRRKYRK